ncbi:ubiquinol oxidase subunit II [Sphingomonas sp.]|uniref:ubiquinol oxidase subunit II n=1 Tax=Sphingomonas sp. TaxID=28214 RepID=UPI001EC5A614|nr:ubiquinol oxidase subunit II [Sphingomonas sp.]MBX3593071.1 ubiquinol oxidase subunit II [Sphingomonas sp.]
MVRNSIRFPGRLRALLPVALLPALAGCGMVVLDPAGDVARQQGNLVMISTALMLLIIVPVMVLTALFAWRYRASNRDATYRPDWDHSTQLELVIWAAPLLIIICLGALTWVGTHLLDPYRPLAAAKARAPGAPDADRERPIDVQVVALDWKWLFIYPEQGIATVNELALPVGRPVRFRISSSSVMNSFYIPALAGQIYAMPGMETKLHGVFDRPGSFTGFSANYSGAGFSNMRFAAKSLSDAGFTAWVAQARAAGGTLDTAAYLKLERPSEKEPVRRYAAVEPRLFDRVVNLCVDPGKMCMHDMMAIDARGGMGREGAYNVRALAYDKFAARGTAPLTLRPTRYVAAICTTPMVSADRQSPAPVDPAPLRGVGLSRPDAPVAGRTARADTPAAAARPLS